MLLATWNVNGLRARLDFVRHWLDARKPDVVGLQELKADEEQFPFAELEAAGYRAVVHAQKAWNGVAILSREPAELVQAGLPGMEEAGARLVTARVGDLELTTVYCPNGKSVEHEDFPAKLAWFDALAEHLGEAGGRRVVCGDFNVCPSPIDSWNEQRLGGRIFHTAEERSRVARLAEAGWIDLYRDLHPDRQAFSWWDYRDGAFHRGMGLRIDLVLGSKAVRERLVSAEIDREYRKKKEGWTASDHAPVMVEIG